MSILTYIRKKLKTLYRIFYVPRWIGPIATILFTIVYHLGSIYFGYSIAVMWIICFLVLGSFVGGLRAGLICAVWISLYSFYAISDLSRVIQIIIGSIGIAFIVGWQTRRLREFYQTADEVLNGNAVKLQEGLQFLREAKTELRKLIQLIELVEDRFGNVLSGVVGYKALREMIQEVDAWHKQPENIKKLQQIEKAKTRPLDK